MWEKQPDYPDGSTLWIRSKTRVWDNRGHFFAAAAEAKRRILLNRARDTIVTEGLLLYFTNNELTQFFENMITLLSRGRNAIWITDLVTQENLNELFASHPGVSRSVRKVFELTGRTIIASNPFQSNACVERYLSEFGLRVDRTVSLRDVAPRLNLRTPSNRSYAKTS